MLARYSLSLAFRALIGTSLLHLMPFPATAQTNIDCTADNGALEAAINSGSTGDLEIDGTCTGGDDNRIGIGNFVLVRLIDSNGTAGVLDTDLNVSSARVDLENITIAGNNAKNVTYVNNASGSIDNTTFGDLSDAPSLQIYGNSRVDVDSSTFHTIQTRNLNDDGPFCTAVCVADNSSVRVDSSTVSGAENGPTIGNPVEAFRNASIVLRGSNTITNNGTQAAVGVYQDSSIRIDDPGATGTPNTLTGGIVVFSNSSAEVRAATIDGDSDNDAVVVGQDAIFRSRATGSFGSNGVAIDGMASNPIVAFQGTVVDIDDDTMVNGGNVSCAEFSQLTNDGFGGSASIDCDNFHVDSNGRVGIGLRTPTSKLHVAGDATFDGTFSVASSRDVKHAFSDVDPRETLDKVVDLPVSEWTYRSDDPSVRHVGPVAEDFSAAFELGRDDSRVSPTDLSGVALAAIQGLHQVVREKDAEIEALRRSRDKLAGRVKRLERLMESKLSNR